MQGSLLRYFFAPECHFISSFIRVHLRFRIAKASYVGGHLGANQMDLFPVRYNALDIPMA
jgi:hypothetical protein